MFLKSATMFLSVRGKSFIELATWEATVSHCLIDKRSLCTVFCNDSLMWLILLSTLPFTLCRPTGQTSKSTDTSQCQ